MSSTSSVDFVSAQPAAGSADLRVDRPSTLVIFGATGDLTARKLMPALFHLHLQNLLPDKFNVLGVARREISDDAFREAMRSAVQKHSRTQPVADDAWAAFAPKIRYHQLAFDNPADYPSLAGRLNEIEKQRDAIGQRLFYLATDPSFFSPIVRQLGAAGLIRNVQDPKAARVIIEKPFGHDLESATAMTGDITAVLDENQIYRIDHYLGKETVLNILSFRFGNAIFEPLFNSTYVDHVQITVAESLGMEGRRGGYYDRSGALRDVIQNHALQLLCLVAMEPPAVFGPKEIRDEKVKILQSLRPCPLGAAGTRPVRGQYVSGSIDGQTVEGYRNEQGVDPRSHTETYVALRIGIDNWRWAGVPFLLRTGKRMPKRVTEIAVQFKLPPLHLFTTVECEGDVCDISRSQPNVLVFRIQPDEGISLSFSAKRPGMLFQIHPAKMDFIYGRSFAAALPEAYERLLLDALRGDSTLFTRSDEVASAWRFLDPILKSWSSENQPPAFYEAGSWGPTEADRLLTGCDGTWRTP